MDLMMKRLPFLFLVVVVSYVSVVVSATGVFRVHHKFAGKERSLSDFKAHDERRHGRILGAVDIPLGGTGLPSEAGLYFAEIRLGTPPKSYYVQVDTGSDILWVNCIECNRCPKKSDLGIQLSLYDIKNSASGSLVTCDQPFCSTAYSGQIEGCEPNVLCSYSVTYGDGSTTAGYYVKDSLQYNQASGNLQTTTANASVIFGLQRRNEAQPKKPPSNLPRQNIPTAFQAQAPLSNIRSTSSGAVSMTSAQIQELIQNTVISAYASMGFNGGATN